MEKFKSILIISDFDSETIQDAKSMFNEFKKIGIIKNGSFDDNKWFLSNEVYNVNFHFDIDNFEEYETTLNITKDQFIEYMKTYAVYRIGEIDFKNIQSVLLGIKRVVACPIEKVNKLDDDVCIVHSSRISEFFSMIPSEGREEGLQILSEKLDLLEENFKDHLPKNQRVLASFESYFLFDDILKDFWQSSIDDDERLFYFPMYLWWNLTTIIPTRPTAFCLTPRNCLTREKDSYFLTMRRSRIKGKEKKKGNRIEKDYELVKYEVPEDIYYLIQWYIEKTKNHKPSEIGTLFRINAHYSKWGRIGGDVNRYYTYENLSTAVRYFFCEIVQGRYGYKIIFDKSKKHLDDNEIQYINLGDTRHLAMINLIASGSSPIIAQILAGHENIDISAHYFSNIKQMISCRVRTMYSKQRNGTASYQLDLTKNPIFSGNYINVEGGKCYSGSVRNGFFSDCMNAIGDNGAIGVCSKCDYFLPTGISFSEKKDYYENEIDTEINNLKEIVARVRSERGYIEEIEQSVKALHNKEYSYRQYLIEELKNEGD